MWIAACFVAWLGSDAGWHALALAMGQEPAAPCPGMEVALEQRADDGDVWRTALRPLLTAHAWGAQVAAAAAAAAASRASGAPGKPAPRRGASEIAEAALAAAGPRRDGPLHLGDQLEGAPAFHGAAVRHLGLAGAAGARAARGMTWALGAAGMLEVAAQPSGAEGAEVQGAPDTFRGLSARGARVAEYLARPGEGGSSHGDPSIEAEVGVAVVALRTAARGRGPLRAALEGESVGRLHQLRRAMRLLEQRLECSPRVP